MNGKRIMQEHCFWEIRDGESANFWEDSWNQLPKLGLDSRWRCIQERGIEEDREKVNHYQGD